ncbi:leucine-rich repeat transmembrane neuronal protein 4-like [Anopheles ziemanni]|uniref:leucine-rich repeat transmembrane neuronal protein 4-like n=1 Tax=Anopheles coustani TaxID=139045 RepID=UPI00265861F0|nr:leucine-rich repeat transmembrane neuronal protein 4-like [Anopheles coustani]XP_058178240.1 leucine-rich repeat transmembrane neuronal protein 4-like [Anopheles ziemanni]
MDTQTVTSMDNDRTRYAGRHDRQVSLSVNDRENTGGTTLSTSYLTIRPTSTSSEVESTIPNALRITKNIGGYICKWLYLDFNYIASLDPGVFDNLVALEVLAITGNNLSSIPLVLSYNNLNTTAWLNPFRVLEFLDLSHNKIEDITSEDFKRLQRLSILMLGNNRLYTFDMSSDILRSLKVLDLSSNELVYVEDNQKQFDLLEELHLDHNSLIALQPSSSWKLKNITLSYNDWDCVKMERLLRSFPPNVSIDFKAETYCPSESTARIVLYKWRGNALP